MNPSQIPRISVNGTPLSPTMAGLLVDAVVDDDLYLPDMFELRLADPERTLAERMPFRIGAVVEIRTGALGEDPSTLLINGEVTAIEMALDASGSFVTVTGYDQSHRLHRGRKTATFNDTTESDLAWKIASAAGLAKGTVDSTSPILDHVGQANETDWNFLQRRARETGNRVFVKEGAFHFRTGTEADGASVKARYGTELLEFRARMTANEQVGAVEVRGWNVQTKEAISERIDTRITTAALAGSSIAASTIDSSFGASTHVRTNLAIGSQEDAKTAADGVVQHMSSAQLYATGSLIGNPKAVAGSRLVVDGTGKAFDGEWVVSHSRHVFDHLGYTTHFTVSGDQDRSLAGLIAGLAPASTHASAAMGGVSIGVVTDTADPEQLGRVRVALPIIGDQFETFWARVVYPGAGAARGLFLCPERNDEVLVAFHDGDVRRPFVLGGLFNGKDKPDSSSYQSSSDGAIIRRSWTSRKGHRIVILEDPNNAEGDMINIVTVNGAIVSVKDNGELSIDAKKAVLSLSETFEIAADGDVHIAGKNVTIGASGKLELTASSGAKLDGGSSAAISGGSVTLN